MLTGQHIFLTDTVMTVAVDVMMVPMFVIFAIFGGGTGGGGGGLIWINKHRTRHGVDFFRQHSQQHTNSRYFTTHPLQPIQCIANRLSGQRVRRDVDGVG